MKEHLEPAEHGVAPEEAIYERNYDSLHFWGRRRVTKHAHPILTVNAVPLGGRNVVVVSLSRHNLKCEISSLFRIGNTTQSEKQFSKSSRATFRFAYDSL